MAWIDPECREAVSLQGTGRGRGLGITVSGFPSCCRWECKRKVEWIVTRMRVNGMLDRWMERGQGDEPVW